MPTFVKCRTSTRTNTKYPDAAARCQVPGAVPGGWCCGLALRVCTTCLGLHMHAPQHENSMKNTNHNMHFWQIHHATSVNSSGQKLCCLSVNMTGADGHGAPYQPLTL